MELEVGVQEPDARGTVTRVSLMVFSVSPKLADKFARFLLNCATIDKITRLPNAANKEDDLQVHRYSFVTLEGGKQAIRLGMLAAEQKSDTKKRVMTGSDWDDLEYRIDTGAGPRKVGETHRPVQPVQPSAPSPAPKSTVPKGVNVWNTPSGSAYPEEYPPLPQTKPTAMNTDTAHMPELLVVKQRSSSYGQRSSRWPRLGKPTKISKRPAKKMPCLRRSWQM
jgi:hypothetical protein